MLAFRDERAFEYENRLSLNNEAIRPEDTLKINEFGNTHKWHKQFAIAFKVRNLVLIEKGTIPSNVDMGVGIRNYVMEFLDSETISNLKEEIFRQVHKYIPNNNISRLELKTNEDDKRIERNSLLLVLGFGKFGDDDDITEIALKFGTNSIDKNKLVTEMFY